MSNLNSVPKEKSPCLNFSLCRTKSEVHLFGVRLYPKSQTCPLKRIHISTFYGVHSRKVTLSKKKFFNFCRTGIEVCSFGVGLHPESHISTRRSVLKYYSSDSRMIVLLPNVHCSKLVLRCHFSLQQRMMGVWQSPSATRRTWC